jgi:hypothetical protein
MCLQQSQSYENRSKKALHLTDAPLRFIATGKLYVRHPDNM